MRINCGRCKGRHESVAQVRACYATDLNQHIPAVVRPYEDHLMEVLDHGWSPESPPDKWRRFHHSSGRAPNRDGEVPEWNYEQQDQDEDDRAELWAFTKWYDEQRHRDRDREPPDWDDMG